MDNFFFESFPFFVSIVLVVSSPVILRILTKRTDQKIDIAYPNDPYVKNLKKFFSTLADFLIDGLTIISGFILSTSTTISISFLRDNPILGYSMTGILIVVTILLITYFTTYNVNKHRKMRWGKFSYFSYIVIAYNIVVIIVLAKQWNLF